MSQVISLFYGVLQTDKVKIACEKAGTTPEAIGFTNGFLGSALGAVPGDAGPVPYAKVEKLKAKVNESLQQRVQKAVSKVDPKIQKILGKPDIYVVVADAPQSPAPPESAAV